MFDDGDEFGVQEFREDFSYLYDINKIRVKVIDRKEQSTKATDEDFLGLTQSFDQDPSRYIYVNIMSQSPQKGELGDAGYGKKGVSFECYTEFDTEIINGDIVEFTTDYSYGIKAKDKFRIELGDFGTIKGQYNFKNFIMYRV